ncbi:hypothetical protein RHMOL_Rhmol10G0206200 [Rhododendron molle]|uniref:Uncharacterized protein n=1 Tax=Rhododendron molle TaxID=49168 RepID=A0ACC0M677_RHOML|nr:hypothetical protein RHMOL_Rhmol10G0206200 [Rhododendron molle]
MNHQVNLLAGAYQLRNTIETMTTQLVENPDFIVLAEKRDFKRVQKNTPIPVEEDPWFPEMFPILCAFHGFFGALPPMENFEVGDEEEEIGDEDDANEATLKEDETPEAEDAN